MSEDKLGKGSIVTLLASYCEDSDCTDRLPCYECVKMCNQYEIQEFVPVLYKGSPDLDE